jgi:hypothetical protein
MKRRRTRRRGTRWRRTWRRWRRAHRAEQPQHNHFRSWTLAECVVASRPARLLRVRPVTHLTSRASPCVLVQSKGFLAQHLADHFGRRVNVSVVDIEPKRVANGAARAARRGVRRSTADAPANNLHFVAGDAAALSARGVLPDADLVLGLHACGGLSDLIIAHAVTHGAAFAVCPCCYLTNRALDVPCAPLADAHGTRTGTLSRDEWLVAGVDDGAATRFSHAALRTLLRAAEQNDDPSTAELGARSVNALRAAAAQRHWAHGRPHGATPKLSVELRAFDARYSAKNCVLVGRPEPLSPKTEQDAEQGKAA